MTEEKVKQEEMKDEATTAEEAKTEEAKTEEAKTTEEVNAQEVKTAAEQDKAAEKICKWGAARAGVIVVTPLLGTVALMANEVYMITRLADMRGIALDKGAAIGFAGSMAATFVGQIFATLIPLPPIQIPVAIGVTYAVGKVADEWLKAGCPKDLAPFKALYERAKKEGMNKVDELSKMDCKDIPLGDETKKFMENAEPYFNKMKEHADKAAEKVEDAIAEAWLAVQPFMEKGGSWINAQNWEAVKHGGITVPYEEIKSKLKASLQESSFIFEDCKYHAPNAIEIDVNHKDHGDLHLVLSVAEFTINNTTSFVRLKVEDFAIENNDFAQLIVETLGSKLIMSIVNALFKNTMLESEGLTYAYADNNLTINIDKMVQNNKYVQKKIKEKNILDIINFTGLEPQEKGVLVQSKIVFKK